MDERERRILDNSKLIYHCLHKHHPTYAFDEDIIMEAYIGLIKAVDTYQEGKSAFSTYATTCILNQIKMHFRSNNKHAKLDLQSIEQLQETNFDPPDSRSEYEFESSLNTAVLNHLVSKLRPVDQEFIKTWIDSDGHTATVARRLGISRQAASTKYQHILERLRKAATRGGQRI